MSDVRGARHVACIARSVQPTKDVNFLVGDEGFTHHGGGIVPLKVPIEVNGEDEVDKPTRTEGIPVVSIEALFLLNSRHTGGVTRKTEYQMSPGCKARVGVVWRC